MNHLIVLSAILFSAMAYSENASRERRIISGKPIKKNEWPFLVSLHYLLPHEFTNKTQMKHMCGGALIRPQWVLTAAHCFQSRDMAMEKNWNVVLGEYNQYLKEDGEQIIKPKKFFIHPQFEMIRNDIALIKLTEEAITTSSVGDIAVSQKTSVEVDTECKVGGWGQLADEPSNLGMFLPLKTKVSVLDINTCNDSYSYMKEFVTIDSSTICAGNPEYKQSRYQILHDKNPDSCQGDSGGPLLCPTGNNEHDQVSGIVSLGRGCGSAVFPGVYTNVSFFTDWIKEVIEKN